MSLLPAAKQQYMFALEQVVREVGIQVLAFNGRVHDTQHIRGHEESSIDSLAYQLAIGAFQRHFAESGTDKFKYLFELRELQDESPSSDGKYLVLRIDEIDGTTNTKRALGSPIRHKPSAAVTIALCEDESMGSIVVGALYDMLHDVTFSGIHVEGHYFAFADRRLLNPSDFEQKQGDSSTRIMVVGYSNKERTKKAEIEAAILAADRTGKDYRIYDGCRSSTIDVLNILRNQFDAYVDARALWPKSGAMLYPYDIAGVIPVALGCGLVVTDAYGRPIDTYSAKNVPLSVIIARKELHPRLVEAIRSALPPLQ